MSHRRKYRKFALVPCIAAAFAVTAPSAQADDVVNQARVSHPGTYVAIDGDRNPPARFKSGLGLLGSNAGLTNAAAHSPALSVAIPAPGDPDDGGGESPT